MLNPSVSVVGFKNFCASIPLKGDLKTQINFPTGLHWKYCAEDLYHPFFRAYGCLQMQPLGTPSTDLCVNVE